MHRNTVISALPTYEATQRAWPTLNPAEGRIIVYWPRLPVGGLGFGPQVASTGARVGQQGAGGSVGVNFLEMGGGTLGSLYLDAAEEVRISDETFLFADLYPGLHKVEFKVSPTSSRRAASFEIRRGAYTYVRFESNQFTDTAPVIVDEAVALRELAQLRYFGRQAFPFNRRPPPPEKKP